MPCLHCTARFYIVRKRLFIKSPSYNTQFHQQLLAIHVQPSSKYRPFDLQTYVRRVVVTRQQPPRPPPLHCTKMPQCNPQNPLFPAATAQYSSVHQHASLQHNSSPVPGRPALTRERAPPAFPSTELAFYILQNSNKGKARETLLILSRGGGSEVVISPHDGAKHHAYPLVLMSDGWFSAYYVPPVTRWKKSTTKTKRVKVFLIRCFVFLSTDKMCGALFNPLVSQLLYNSASLYQGGTGLSGQTMEPYF